MPDNVTRLHKTSDNACTWTVAEMLEDALQEVREGTHQNRKAMIIFLDDRKGYNFAYSQAGMSYQEVVSLLDNMKMVAQHEMLYPEPQ